MMATIADAHREWHRNTGTPMGQPGCPQDACHPPEDPTDYGFPLVVDSLFPGAVKCGNKKGPYGSEGHYHLGTSAVRECYAATGRFTGNQPVAAPAPAPVVAPAPAPAPAPAAPGLPPLPTALWKTIPVGAKGYGYYALSAEQTGDKVRFFRVEQAQSGKYKGMVFIKEQGGDSFYPVEPKRRGFTYMTLIAENPEEAGRLYAAELDKCTRCNRTLTDPESRERSMGPDCYGRTGGW